jgi:hypothetical protein
MPWPEFEVRFWRRVRKDQDCWTWTGPLLQDGYGQIRWNGKTLGAHRAAYQLLVGPVPDHLWVLHTCNNPSCVNPLHLYLGTVEDNNRDRDRAGRQARLRGPLNGHDKLTWEKVAEIRTLYADGQQTYKSLGHLYKVDRTMIGQIIRNETWKEEWRPQNV